MAAPAAGSAAAARLRMPGGLSVVFTAASDALRLTDRLPWLRSLGLLAEEAGSTGSGCLASLRPGARAGGGGQWRCRASNIYQGF
jgi:hypothetical protein